MTNPPQDDDRPDPTVEQPAAPAQPDFARPPQPGPDSQYGRPAGSYGPPSYGAPPSGPPPYGQPGQAQPWGPPPAPGLPHYGPPGSGQPGASAWQQPYGQQPFTPPPARRRSRAALIAVLAGVLLLLVAGGLAVAFAFRSTELDPHAVERDVAAQFQKREGVAVDLNCSDEMAVRKGKSYECTGVTADDEPVTVKITITDEDTAAYTWTEP